MASYSKVMPKYKPEKKKRKSVKSLFGYNPKKLKKRLRTKTKRKHKKLTPVALSKIKKRRKK